MMLQRSKYQVRQTPDLSARFFIRSLSCPCACVHIIIIIIAYTLLVHDGAFDSSSAGCRACPAHAQTLCAAPYSVQPPLTSVRSHAFSNYYATALSFQKLPIHNILARLEM